MSVVWEFMKFEAVNYNLGVHVCICMYLQRLLSQSEGKSASIYDFKIENTINDITAVRTFNLRSKKVYISES
jgi:hypothetical protein